MSCIHGERGLICIRCDFETSRKEKDHKLCGRAGNDGPEDPDCTHRGTNLEAECAAEGCGFCKFCVSISDDFLLAENLALKASNREMVKALRLAKDAFEWYRDNIENPVRISGAEAKRMITYINGVLND